MTYEVFYKIKGVSNSIIVEGETIEDIKFKTNIELEKICGVYSYSNWLNN